MHLVGFTLPIGRSSKLLLSGASALGFLTNQNNTPERSTRHVNMGWKIVHIGFLLSFLFVLVAIWLRPSADREIDSALRTILRGLIDVETLNRIRKPKVAVGYGACMDVFANARDVLEFQETDSHPVTLTTDVELMQAYTYFFRHGAAAEYVVHISCYFLVNVF